MNQPSTNFEEPVNTYTEPEINQAESQINDAEPEFNQVEPQINDMKPQINYTEPTENNSEQEKVQPAGFFIRLAAYLVDYLIAGGIIAMIKFPLWFVKLAVPDSVVFKNILFGYDIFDIVNFCLLSAYFIIMTYTCGRTVGKMLMKIKVVPVKSKELTFGQVFFREVIGKYLSSLLYIGYILVGIDNEKRGIHDMVADTRVVYDMR